LGYGREVSTTRKQRDKKSKDSLQEVLATEREKFNESSTRGGAANPRPNPGGKCHKKRGVVGRHAGDKSVGAAFTKSHFGKLRMGRRSPPNDHRGLGRLRRGKKEEYQLRAKMQGPQQGGA